MVGASSRKWRRIAPGLVMLVCHWRLLTFNMVLLQKELISSMLFAMAGTHFQRVVYQNTAHVVTVCHSDLVPGVPSS